MTNGARGSAESSGREVRSPPDQRAVSQAGRHMNKGRIMEACHAKPNVEQ